MHAHDIITLVEVSLDHDTCENIQQGPWAHVNVLSKKCNKKNFGLCSQDGLESEQIRKSIQKIFKKHGLDIIVQCNMKTINI